MGDPWVVVQDLKGYRGRTDKKARSTGWFVLLISHMAIFIVGISIGHWMGGRFASVSSKQRAGSQEVDSSVEKSVALREQKREEPLGKSNEETLLDDASPVATDQPAEEPEFTFYESLEKEETAGAETKGEITKEEKPDHSGESLAQSSEARLGVTEPGGNSNVSVYYVQLASFREEGRARRLVGRLKEVGYPAEVIPKVVPNKGIWYRVQMGPFASRTEASEMAEAIEKKEKLRSLILARKRVTSP